MRANLRLILIGDVVAKLGRRVAAEVIPEWKKTLKPDLVIANVENLAHGKGVTEKSLAELRDAGVNAFTGGNHVWQKEDPSGASLTAAFQLALPANSPRSNPSQFWQEIPLGDQKVFVLSLLGQVGMHDESTENPFLCFDSIYERMGKPKILMVDLHAETTSEKVALGHYVDGRASVLYGTHTHIPTADARILPRGTGYVTDLGMTGSDDSVLGVDKDIIIKRFLTSAKEPFEYPESGPAWINALYVEISRSTGRCVKIKSLHKKLTTK